MWSLRLHPRQGAGGVEKEHVLSLSQVLWDWIPLVAYLNTNHLLVVHLAASTAMASPLSCNLRVLAKDEGSFAITGLLMSHTPPYRSQPRGHLGTRREGCVG